MSLENSLKILKNSAFESNSLNQIYAPPVTPISVTNKPKPTGGKILHKSGTVSLSTSNVRGHVRQ